MLRNSCFILVACAVMVVPPVAADDDIEQAQREERFAEALSGAVLVGTFSIDGMKMDKLPLQERYELKSVKKAGGGLWTFTARVTFLKQDITLPVTVPVIWAADTPMVSLSDTTLPGLGDHLSAKVIFDGDRYAGTWKHGKFGGHMWGRIERAPVAETEPAATGANPCSQ